MAEQVETVETLDTSELAYHAVTLQQFQFAHAALRQWETHLSQRYKLQQGDEIRQDGTIVRKHVAQAS